MSAVTRDRATTARLITRYLTTPEWRTIMKLNDYRPGTPLIACEWDEPIGDVMDRVGASRPTNSAFLAIRRDETLLWMGVEPAPQEPCEGTVGDSSTIGMLYDAVSQSKTWTVRVTNSATARVLVAA